MSIQQHHDHAEAAVRGTTPRHLTAHKGGAASAHTHDRCPEEPLIGLRDLSVWLGVSESTIRKWAARGPGTGLLPTMIRVNGQLRFRPEDVRTYLREKELR